MSDPMTEKTADEIAQEAYDRCVPPRESLSSNPRGERRCMVGVGPQGETTFEPFVRAAWADAEIERLRSALTAIRGLSRPPEVRGSLEAIHEIAVNASGAADETAPAKDEVLEAILAGRVTYPPEVLPTGRWMPADETSE